MDWWIDGLVDWWIDGLVDWWIGGLVDWWIGGLMDWWIGGLVAACASRQWRHTTTLRCDGRNSEPIREDAAVAW